MMKIDECSVGDVTVVTLRGKITLGEGDELLNKYVNRLVASGRLNLVFDLSGVPYLDSAGNGAFVRTYTTVSRHGGRMVVCNLTKRIEDLWTINRLRTVFETYDSVDAAVRSFGAARFEVSCPICEPVSWNRFLERSGAKTCATCDVRFLPVLTKAIRALLEENAAESTPRPVAAAVKHLWWPTYLGDAHVAEGVQLTLARPATLAITGRLDRFALDVVETAWRAVPRPRRLVIDVTKVENFSPVAWGKVQELCAFSDDGKAVILMPPNAAAPAPKRRSARLITYVDRADAIKALGDLRAAAESLEVKIRRRA
jgi:anti-anti-sigma factor